MLKPVAFMLLRDAVRSEILHPVVHIRREWPCPSSITMMLHKTAGRFCRRCVRSFAVPHLFADIQPSLIPYKSGDRRVAATLATCPSGTVLNMATPPNPPPPPRLRTAPKRDETMRGILTSLCQINYFLIVEAESC